MRRFATSCFRDGATRAGLQSDPGHEHHGHSAAHGRDEGLAKPEKGPSMLPDQNCYASTLPAKRFYTTQAHKRHAAKPCSILRAASALRTGLLKILVAACVRLSRGNGPTAPSVASITPHILKQLAITASRKPVIEACRVHCRRVTCLWCACCCPGPHAVRNSELARTDYRGEFGAG